MLMADYGLGLWGGYADFEPIENENMSIDLDSFMDLLQEEPTDAQIHSDHLSSSDFLTKDLFPSAGSLEMDLGKSATRTGNGSAVDTGMEFIGATENSSCKQMSMLLDMPVKDEACTESSISHYSSSTFGDHISPFTEQRLPVHYNSDSGQAFLFNKEMSLRTKDEAEFITSNCGRDRLGPKTSSGVLIADVSDVVEPDSKYDAGDDFLVLDGGCATGLNDEAKEQPFSWGSLYMSTFSSDNQVVKEERHDLTVPSSNMYLNIGSSCGATIRNNFSFSETRHLGVKEEDKEIDLARNSKEACFPGNGIKEDGSSSKFLQANGTHMLHRVRASLHQRLVKEKDRRVGMAAPNIKSQNSCINEDLGTLVLPNITDRPKSSGMFVLPNVTNATPSNRSPESTQSNSVDCRSQVDDESDICIIEEMSHPAPSSRSVVPAKSMIFPKPSTFYESRHYSGLGGSRIKTHSERSVLRVAVQDLSQPKLELNPPDGTLSVPLLRHQRIALAWMAKKETAVNCSGGILADDQGLGKTVSTISLILKERPPSSKPYQQNLKLGELQTLDLVDEDNDDGKGIKSKVVKCDYDSVQVPSSAGNRCSLSQKIGRPAGGTLVVCPTSVLRQWADELQNKVTAQTNLSILVYHGGNRTKDPFELCKHDVVVTTYSIVSMEVPKQPISDKDDVDNGKRESQDFPGSESHSSKKRKKPSGSNKRKSKDGNGLLEAAAGPLAKVGWFRVVLDEAQSIKNHKTQVARACWGLRAKRRWCLSGTPIQNTIDDLYSYFKFLRYDPYDTLPSFCTNIKAPIQRNPTKGYKKLQAILKTIMLRRTKATLLDGEPIINLPPKSVILQRVEFSEEERSFYAKLEADSRAQFKEYAAAGTVRENYVNILLMLLRLRQACDHPLLVKGYNSRTEWKSSVEKAKQLPVEKQRDLLNCLEASLAICTICNDPPEEAVVSTCGHVFCNQCLSEHITGDECECPATDCKAKLSHSSTFSKAALNVCLDGDDSSVKPPPTETEEDEHHSAISSPFGSCKIRAAIKVLQSLAKNSVSPNSSQEGLEDKCVKDSNNTKPAAAAGGREKAIVFSQWTKMLDLIEAGLKSSSIQYRRLDGTMTVTARDKAVKDFNTIPEVTVMIMSLKAASLGLNMVSANHVFLMDLWWNPTTEDQAIDRAHRIGQTRPVTVLRLTVEHTVEDRILDLQKKKREMVASAFGEDESKSGDTRLTVDDLNYLFMV